MFVGFILKLQRKTIILSLKNTTKIALRQYFKEDGSSLGFWNFLTTGVPPDGMNKRQTLWFNLVVDSSRLIAVLSVESDEIARLEKLMK